MSLQSTNSNISSPKESYPTKDWHSMTAQEILKTLSSTVQGLTSTEAQKRLNQYGKNELEETSKKSTFRIFLEQFQDFLVIILIIAAIISSFLGDVESSIVILVVITMNAVLGTVQNKKAEQSLNSLKAMSSPNAKVFRNNQTIVIPASDVVPGDILILEAGDCACADGRIIENASMKLNESALTGESTTSEKSLDQLKKETALGDRSNMVFSGSFLTYGRGKVVVTGTGMNTELGKIADLLKNTKEKKTPLQVNLDAFGKKLSIGILMICGFLFIVNLIRDTSFVDAFMFAVALAVAAIPEALSSIVTIVLAFGTQKLAKEHAILRKLQAVEGLGSVSVICSDKTGTLTQNKMTVKQLYVPNYVIRTEKLAANSTQKEISSFHLQTVSVKNQSLHNSTKAKRKMRSTAEFKPAQLKASSSQTNTIPIFFDKLLTASILCNDSSNENGREIGDPTETALLNFTDTLSLNSNCIRQSNKRLAEIPFDSDRKLMTTVHPLGERTIMLTKGAVDVLLPLLEQIETADGIRAITPSDITEIQNQNMDFSSNGLRVLAFAYKDLGTVQTSVDSSSLTEDNYTFLGLIAMIDPPREESKKAVADCIRAGIKPIMITGDHKITAAAIAKEIGILNNMDEAVLGSEIDHLTDEELLTFVDHVSVYARVSPENKIRIVDAWQRKGNIVAMTGDGVNDAPALKQADVGVAMGITGTEVAKDAAAMVLTDDNFATIVKAVENGRNVYANIKKSIQFLLSGNTAGIIAVLYASIAGLPVPFAPVHLLFINLLTDSLPAIALGLEPHTDQVMSEKPRPKNENILTKQFTKTIGLEGLIIAITTIIAYHIGLKTSPDTASTIAFSTLCASRLVHGFNCKSDTPVLFTKRFFNNQYLIGAFLVGTLLLSAVLLIPGLHSVFAIAALTLKDFLVIAGFSLSNLFIIQLLKKLRKK